MLVYLDTCIVIHAVEGQIPFQQRARVHIAVREAAGERSLISDLSREKRSVHPLAKEIRYFILQFAAVLWLFPLIEV